MSIEEAKRRIAHVKENNFTVLDLSKCYLTRLPDELKEIGGQLTHLDLTYNTVGAVGAAFIAQYCPNLQSLKLGEAYYDRYGDWISTGNEIGDDGAKAIAALTALAHLEISDNKIGDEGAKAIAAITGLAHLDISYNKVTYNGAKSIAALTRLAHLDISDNLIGYEGAKAIAAITGLAHLNINYNQIGDDGAKAIAALTGLAHLNINYNQIGDDGAKAIAALTGLAHLNINYNQIGDNGAKAIAALKALVHLDISDNQIGYEGAKAIAALTGLAHLDIHSNQIGYEGAKAIAALAGLVHLDISHNEIGDYGAKVIAALTGLAHLDISANEIGDEGAKAIAALTALAYLEISDNEIGDEGAKAIAALTALTHLYIRDNEIGYKGAKAIAALNGLVHLDISGNKIGYYGAKAIAALTGLAHLVISANKIGSNGATAIAALTGLAHLDISNNQIGDQGAKAIAALTDLAYLEISYNQIGDDGAKAVAALTGLAHLVISANKIGSNGATAIAALTGLAHLDISNNQIGDEGLKILALSPHWQNTSIHISHNAPANIPKDVAQSIDTLREYLNAGQTTSYTRGNVIRIVLCGNTHAGKTSLATKLENINNPNPKKEERTHGIKHWHIKPSKQNGQLNLNIWDFGGQDYYHATHAASLTSSDKENDNKYTIYLLLWRNPKPEIKDEKHIEEMQQFHEDYWLGFIQLLADKPSVDIVQTHTDEARNVISFPESKLKHKYFSLDPTSYHYLSLHDNEILKPKWKDTWMRFESYLYKKIGEKISDNKQEIPVTWKEIRDEVLPGLANDHTTISKADLEEYLLNSEIIKRYAPREEVALGYTGLMAYLKGCGDILAWGDDKPTLKETVVVNIQKFHEDIYDEILTEKVRKQNGVFKAVEQYKFHIDYLLHNELIFKIDNKANTYVAPQYLPAEPLIAHFKDLIPLTLVLRYPYYMPRYLITRCIVKVYKQNNETNYWKYGCISTWENGDSKTKFMIAINPDPDKQEAYFYIQDTRDTYTLLKRFYRFFSSFGADDIWPEKEQPNKLLAEQRESGNEDSKRKEDNLTGIKEDMQLSTDGETFIKIGDIKKALSGNEPIVKTIDGDYIKINTFMHQVVNPNAPRPKKIFFSYSKSELQYLAEFRMHFATLETLGFVEPWYDAMIEPGTKWDTEIKKKLEQADLVLCMLSPSFMSNKYIWNTEMKMALDSKNTKHIVPIFITPCDFEGTFLADNNGGINIKHLPSGYTAYKKVSDGGTIWVAMEEHKPKRDFYYKTILDQLKPIIKL